MIEGKDGAKKAKQSLSQTMIVQVTQVGKERPQSCAHCVGAGHGGGLKDREKCCPAYSKRCDNCGKKG